MSTLTIRIMERRKTNLDEAALQLGYTRMKDGEMRGDISALLNQLAEALPLKTPDEIRRFLMGRDSYMKDPSRTRALRKTQNNPEIVEILAKYPAAQSLVNAARDYIPGDNSYNRIRVYIDFKRDILNIIPEPDAGKIYELIGDILPMDAADME